MVDHSFLSKVKNKDILLADGATGTTLISRGLPSGLTAEAWVEDQPERIIQLHKDFINAGANIILTSTFSASSIRLKGSSLDGKAVYINRKATELSKTAVGDAGVFIAGSLGPVGQLLKPYGPLDVVDVKNAYAEQAQALSTAGVDILVVETQFDMGEIKAAIEGVRLVSTLPLVVSLSYDRGRKTMMGLNPNQAGKLLNDLPVDIIGINCGRSLDENFQNLIDLQQITTKPIWFKPNAGLPHLDPQGKTVYNVTPQTMGSLAPSWLTAGAQIIGGCCGTSPDHLAEISRNVKMEKQ